MHCNVSPDEQLAQTQNNTAVLLTSSIMKTQCAPPVSLAQVSREKRKCEM